ncbi:hypothetical protein G7B40_039300 [Aetokthonos hydrillicola Thurmond2011]|uniref:MoaF-like domain-containing protein n=2 Tax=Aetokthonos TaxID=1550243 RepID=A0AAP5IIH0_9CYAN|nr:hypothetical protein [Aetokthonos hydrillicola Thurmond2011]
MFAKSLLVSFGLGLSLFSCGIAQALPKTSNLVAQVNFNDAQEGDFPAVGHVYKVNFGGDYVFLLNFKSDTELTFTGTVGQFKGYSETVQITPIKIRPQVFMVYWTEADKTEVVHVEDFEKGIVYTNIFTPNQPAVHLKGTLQRVH